MKWYWLSADGPGSPRIAGTYVRTSLTGNNVIWVLGFFGLNVWAKRIFLFSHLYNGEKQEGLLVGMTK